MCTSIVPNENKNEGMLKSFSNFRLDKESSSTKHVQELEQLCGCRQPTHLDDVKKIVNRRVTINRDITYSVASIKKAEDNSNSEAFSVACRAVLRPTNLLEEPKPQFEKIEKEKSFTTKTLPVLGNKNPFVCPVSFCKNIIPVSDLIKHFKLNHIRVPIVPVAVGACTNLFWETKVDQFGTSQCLMLLLSNRKGKVIGDGHIMDSTPVAIMTTKVKLSDLAEVECSYENDRHFYLIWLTAMTSSLEPVYYTITAWCGKDNGRVHVVNTTKSYSIRADQNPKMVYRSGMVMILTSEQINRLSNGNEDMVKLQVVVH